MYDVLRVGVDRAEDAWKYLERELVIEAELEPETSGAKVGHSQLAEILS